MPDRHAHQDATQEGVCEAKAEATVSNDERVVAAWREWLEALGTDAEAALAASLAYEQLDAAGRDRWLAAVEQDARDLDVPRIAIYAPLLAVEADVERRDRIERALGASQASATPRCAGQGLCGVAPDGTRVATIITPLYLDFVEVLACGYRLDTGISWVKHDPIVDRRAGPHSGDVVGSAELEASSVKVVIDELAHAVVAHSRSGKPLPEALRAFADLFRAAVDPVAVHSAGP